jgi:hypothetical protein
MASDVDAIGVMYEAPVLAVREGRAIHLGDRAALREHLTEPMAAYARSGAARAEIAALDVVPLGKSSAFTTAHGHVRDAGLGSAHEERRVRRVGFLVRRPDRPREGVGLEDVTVYDAPHPLARAPAPR